MSTKVWSPYQGGSHKVGISTVLAYLKCPMRAHLDRLAQDNCRRGSMDQPKIWVGALIHELLELYYKGQPIHVVLDDEEDTELVRALETAWLVFRRYRAAFPSNEFGTPVEVEVSHPANEEETCALDDVLFENFSCKFDLVIKTDEEMCARLEKTRGLVLLPETYYIVDHKSMGYLYKQWRQLFYDSVQFAAYSMAFAAMWPDRPYGGVIVNCIGTDKRTAVHRSLLVQPPLEEKEAVVHHCVGLYQEAKKAHEPNPVHCHFPEVCPWLGSHCWRV